MAQEQIGTRNGEPFYVGTADSPAPTPVAPPVTRYTTPATDPVAIPSSPTITAPTGPAPVDENAIREQTRKNMQASIDAIDAEYANRLTQENTAGQDRAGQTRAVNARSGTLGQDFGNAQQEKTTQYNQQQVKAIQDEQNTKIQSVLTNIEDRASQEIANKKAEALGQYQRDTTAYQQAQEQAKNDLKTLAESGTDLSSLSPAQKAALFKQAGYTDTGMAEVIYNAMKPKPKQIDYKFEKLADGQGLFYGTDPTTGQLVTQKVSVPVPPGYSLTVAPDGTPLIFNKDTGEAKIADGFSQSQFSKPDQSQVIDPKEKFTLQLQLKKDFDTVTQQSRIASNANQEINTAYQQALSDIKNGKSLNASSQAVIVAFNKLIDPTSVVRESEYARTPEGQSLLNRISGKITQLKQGGAGLTQADLKGLVDTANELVKGFDNYQLEQAQIVKNNADKYGLDMSLILPQSILDKLDSSNGSGIQLTPLTRDVNAEGVHPLLKKYPYKEVRDYLIANPKATEADIEQGLKELGITGFNSAGNASASTGARTDRHNNPTAFTTDIAKLAGLREGVDYVPGDPFSNGKYRTAKILGDPIATTIKVIDHIGFYTDSGKPRWTYVNSIPQTKNWDRLSYSEKANVIKQMYQHEGGTQLLAYFNQNA